MRGGSPALRVRQDYHPSPTTPNLYEITITLENLTSGAALGLADEAVVLDVYAAREDPEPGVTGKLIADASCDKPGFPARLGLKDIRLALAAADLLAMGLFTDSWLALILAVIGSGLFLGVNNRKGACRPPRA